MYKCRLSCYERLENTVIQTTYKFMKISSLALVEQYVASIAGSLAACFSSHYLLIKRKDVKGNKYVSIFHFRDTIRKWHMSVHY